jgi:hypothetical protein
MTDDELVKAQTAITRMRKESHGQGKADCEWELFNHCVERFNPPGADGLSTLGMIDLAADVLEEIGCACPPDAEEEGTPCRRCEALGRLNDKLIER